MWLKKRILKLLFWLFDRVYQVDYLKIDKTAMANWLYDSYKEKGAMEYYRIRDYTLLKTMGMGLNDQLYWIHLGRRLELMTLFDEMRKVDQLRKLKQQRENKNAKTTGAEKKEGGESNGNNDAS